MSKLLVVGAVLLLLDVFPGSCGGCGQPSTIAGPCKTVCDCNANMNAPIRCPGQWDCNADKQCEYTCRDTCLDDGGCRIEGETCSGVVCITPRTSCQ